MLLIEYDYATDIEVQREEVFEKGIPHIQPPSLQTKKICKTRYVQKELCNNINKRTYLGKF